jgi:Flp pilus assembly protein TadD
LLARTLRDCAVTMAESAPASALSMLDELHAAKQPASDAQAAEICRLRAECLGRLDRRDERLSCLQDEAEIRLAAARSGDPVERLLAIEDELWDAGRAEAALTLLDKAVAGVTDGGSGPGRLRLRRADRLSALQRDAEATEDVAAIGDQHPEIPGRRYVVAALVHWRAGRRTEAVAALDTTLAVRPGQYHARFLRGRFHTLLGRPEAALFDLSAARDRAPDDGATRAALADTLVSIGDFDAAVREAHLAVDLEPALAETHVSFGVALLAAGHRADANAELDHAIRLLRARPDGAGAADTGLRVSFCQIARGDVRAAVEEAGHALSHRPAPYLVWEMGARLKAAASGLPHLAEGGAAVLRVLGSPDEGTAE